MKKHGIKLAVVALISLVFLFLFFRKVDWGQFLRYATSANPVFFALIIVLAPLHLATRALRWHVLLRYQKKGVRFASTFSANAVGFTVSSVFPGRLGEIVKPLYLARKEGMGPGFAWGPWSSSAFSTSSSCAPFWASSSWRSPSTRRRSASARRRSAGWSSGDGSASSSPWPSSRSASASISSRTRPCAS